MHTQYWFHINPDQQTAHLLALSGAPGAPREVSGYAYRNFHDAIEMTAQVLDMTHGDADAVRRHADHGGERGARMQARRGQVGTIEQRAHDLVGLCLARKSDDRELRQVPHGQRAVAEFQRWTGNERVRIIAQHAVAHVGCGPWPEAEGKINLLRHQPCAKIGCDVDFDFEREVR